MIKRPARAGARIAGLPLTSDGAIGAVGCCLAVAALSFGVYQNVHGPAESVGKSHDFSVFAQLAPRAAPASQPADTKDDDLDTTATASIPGHATPDIAGPRDVEPSSIVVEAADRDIATIAIGGRIQQVRLGDAVPGAGEVSAIVPGPRPLVRTTRGFTLSSRER